MKRSSRIRALWLTVAIAAAVASRAEATTFAYYDDPFSALSLASSSTGNDALVTVHVTNTGPTHDIGVLIPILNVNSSLTWNQTMNGWSGTVGGISLLITAPSPAARLPYSQVADLSGAAQEVVSALGQTTNAGDSYPFVDLGVMTPSQSSVATFTLHFGWGPSGAGVPHFGFFAETIAPNPSATAVPEPSTLPTLATGLASLGAVVWRRRRLR